MANDVFLNDDELERYARHIVLRHIGGPGQLKLKSARILVIGAGGLGSPALMYLAAAGIGTLGIIDDDIVSLSNLQRQVLHGTAEIGIAKVESAKSRLAQLNPHVDVLAIASRLDASNAAGIIADFDLVIDGSDNFSTRYLVNDACYFGNKTLVSGSVGQFDGTLTTFRAFETGADGNPNPSYRCLFPEPPPREMAPNCEEAGVLGALTGMIGAMQAMEAIKEITGAGTSLVGRLLSYDALDTRFHEIRYSWDPENPLNGDNPTISDLSIHD
ncbi:MAG: molybdopterin-synthase adenylyltransferase MoeB [Rhizobiales bacterium]|nr:molybdopterin-synthase adenylyltransferase MoeB [Hyphomicrobiales bacterium]